MYQEQLDSLEAWQEQQLYILSQPELSLLQYYEDTDHFIALNLPVLFLH